MEQEIWKSLKGTVECGDNYDVSSLGNVRSSTTGKQLKPKVTIHGYLQLGLRYQGKRKYYGVHRLVALAFIPNPDSKPEVNHIDGVKINCELSNLEWATKSENTRHAYDTGLAKGKKGSENAASILTEDDVIHIKEMLRDDKPLADIAKKYNIARTLVSSIKTGALWSHVKVSGFEENKERSTGSRKRLGLLHAHLTEEQVVELRELYKTRKYTQAALATKYGVSVYVVSDILRGKTWKHLL